MKKLIKTRNAVSKSENSVNDLILSGVKITHPNRLVLSTKDVTKGEIAEYYNTIAELILPHLINRPSVLVRCTESYSKNSNKNSKTECFYQKHYVPSFPKSVYRIDIQEESKKSPYLFIKNKTGLLSLIQFSTVEIHSWGSTCKNIEHPDRIIFDLDPGPKVAWKTVINTAFLIRERLQSEFKLLSFVKTTGGKGLHIVIPIQPKNTWQEVKSFSKNFALSLAEDYPNLYTTNPLKVKRQSKIFIDYLRNARGALFVAPYSTRAKPGAPISLPLRWEELNRLKSADSFTVSNIKKRLTKRYANPWKGFFQCKQRLKV